MKDVCEAIETPEEIARLAAEPGPEERAAVLPDMPREDYDRLDRVNWSRLKHLLRSPAHYRQALLAQRPDSDAMKRGRAVHLAVLEPERFAVECVVWRGGRRAGKEWERFAQENSEREILTENEHDLCLAIAAAVQGRKDAARYLTRGRSEVTVKWAQKSADLGAVPGWEFDCKGRLDFVSGAGVLVDLKTTRDASPDGFAKEVWKHRYHTQVAWYADGYEAATGRALPFVLVAVETEAPHVVQVYRVPDEILELGREEYRALLERLAQCRRENSWSGYAEEEMALTLPRWAVPRLDDDDVTDLDLVIGE